MSFEGRILDLRASYFVVVFLNIIAALIHAAVGEIFVSAPFCLCNF